jgi:hypothetical protein
MSTPLEPALEVARLAGADPWAALGEIYRRGEAADWNGTDVADIVTDVLGGLGLGEESRTDEPGQSGRATLAAADDAGPEPKRECRFHGEVDYDHAPCRRPGESADEFSGRMLGEIRDV